MDKKQMLDNPHVETQDVGTDEESTLLRQIAALQRQIAALREDNEDLRASALWWNALYEEAQRRATSRVDQRFRMPSSTPAHASRPDAGAATFVVPNPRV